METLTVIAKLNSATQDVFPEKVTSDRKALIGTEGADDTRPIENNMTSAWTMKTKYSGKSTTSNRQPMRNRAEYDNKATNYQRAAFLGASTEETRIPRAAGVKYNNNKYEKKTFRVVSEKSSVQPNQPRTNATAPTRNGNRYQKKVTILNRNMPLDTPKQGPDTSGASVKSVINDAAKGYETESEWHKQYRTIRESMYKLGIKVSHEPYGTNNPNLLAKERPYRIILTSLFRNKLSQINAECNGLILELDTKKPLVIPPIQFVTTIPDTNQINVDLSNNVYDIYSIEDGTTISLYYWNAPNLKISSIQDDASETKQQLNEEENIIDKDYNPWRIATSNGIDVSDVKWTQKTYRDILHEVFAAKNIDRTAFYASLDKTCCYTLGFRHPEFHPFRNNTDLYKLWSIQSVHRETYKRNYESFGGLTPQMPLEQYAGIANIKILYRTLSSAFNDYVAESHDKQAPTYSAKTANAENDSNSGKNICFGYILRPHDPDSQFRPILLESSLLRKIKSMHYARDISREAHTMGYDRIKYIILRSYVSQAAYDFIQLFPQYEKQYAELDEIVQKLSKQLLLIKSDSDDAIIAKIKTDLAKHINVSNFVSTTGQDAGVHAKEDKTNLGLITSFIKSYKHIDVLYQLWTK